MDPSGQTYWIGSLRNGKSLRQFRAQLFGSSEYFVKAGGTNAAFVRRAYEDVLGRKPDSSGQAYWTNKANAGTERGLIARQFLASAEAKRTIVRDQFLRFLDRQPTSYELANWTTSLDSVNGSRPRFRLGLERSLLRPDLTRSVPRRRSVPSGPCLLLDKVQK